MPLPVLAEIGHYPGNVTVLADGVSATTRDRVLAQVGTTPSATKVRVDAKCAKEGKRIARHADTKCFEG